MNSLTKCNRCSTEFDAGVPVVNYGDPGWEHGWNWVEARCPMCQHVNSIRGARARAQDPPSETSEPHSEPRFDSAISDKDLWRAGAIMGLSVLAWAAISTATWLLVRIIVLAWSGTLPQNDWVLSYFIGAALLLLICAGPALSDD